MPLSDPDRERVARAADLLDEALADLGLRPGVGHVHRALQNLEGIPGVDPVESEGGTVDRLRAKLDGRFAPADEQLPAGRRALERRAES